MPLGLEVDQFLEDLRTTGGLLVEALNEKFLFVGSREKNQARRGPRSRRSHSISRNSYGLTLPLRIIL